ncbi:MAG TPA: TrmH family RNA methyltransferase [Candidatus Saccharimonadales bacterium]|jgi:tRNA G18 (ribose-2'-O)-methylase SpoU
MDDTRNVMDEFKGMEHDAIVAQLNARGISLEIAIENTLRDYNMGSIVRTANAFGVRTVHVIGRRQWNKRGAMMTDRYLHVRHYASLAVFSLAMQQGRKTVKALENNISSNIPCRSMYETDMPDNLVLLIGQEGAGLSDELLSIADEAVYIPQLGSTRSLNVAVAAGIAMAEWMRQHEIQKDHTR